MNQQASKMEIDHNAIRGTGTGDPNFKIDVTALPGKAGALPAMTSLSGGCDPSGMSPIQKAGHTVSGDHPNAQSNSLMISSGGQPTAG